MSLFFVATLFNQKVRQSTSGLIKAAFSFKLITAVALLIAYVVGVICMLKDIGIWTPSLLKDTIVWFVFSGVALAFSFLSKNLDEGILRKVIIDNIKVIVILEFVVDLYTFSLPTELFLVPFIAFIAGMDAVAKMDEKYSIVSKFTAFIQVAFGLVIISSAIIRAIQDYQSLETVDSIRQVALAPILSISLIPYIYIFVVYSNYEQIFVRLEFRREKENEVIRYAKWRIVKHLRIRPKRIREFLRAHPVELLNIRTRDDVDKLIFK
jgi:hypothetical protein